MKLLLDQNLPRQLAGDLQASFPGTAHVWHLGLAEASDADLWDYRVIAYLLLGKTTSFRIGERGWGWG